MDDKDVKDFVDALIVGLPIFVTDIFGLKIPKARITKAKKEKLYSQARNLLDSLEMLERFNQPVKSPDEWADRLDAFSDAISPWLDPP